MSDRLWKPQILSFVQEMGSGRHLIKSSCYRENPGAKTYILI